MGSILRFESLIDVPAKIEPTMETRLRKEFPELKWVDHAENWGKIRIEGVSQNANLTIVVSRKEPPGPFWLLVLTGDRDESEALKINHEVIRRIAWAFIGWWPFPLPHFKPRPAAGADVDREEIVELRLPVEGPKISISAFSAEMLISRSLVEGLSLHLEVLEPWARTLPRESGGDEPETRDALLRGRAARVILRQSVSTDTSEDLQAILGLVQPAHGLLGELLGLGLAEVVLYGPGGPVPGAQTISPARIKVTYSGRFISCSAEDAEFLRLKQ